MSLDLKLISDKFLDADVPQSKEYLFNYFENSIQKKFVSYYFHFGESLRYLSKDQFSFNFLDHSGSACLKEEVDFWLRLVIFIEKKLKKANDDFDLDLAEKIKKGKFKARVKMRYNSQI